MKLRDRLSGVEVELPPQPCLSGRWIFVESEGEAPTYLNGVLASQADLLVPSGAGHWALVRPGDTGPARGRFYADATLDEQDEAALLELGRVLDEPRSWFEWSLLSPLAPGLDDILEPHELEAHIEKELKHLREVCREPRTHIRVETERVLVSRARKIAASAPRWLSAHTEDWSHRTIVGVQPRRILAEVREEQWDLYENRVAVRLIDHLVAWLRRRVGEVRRVKEGIFGPLEQMGDATRGGSRHRRERLFHLWGEAYKEQEKVAERVNRAIARLEKLLYAMLGLMDSTLYKRVPRRARVPRALRMTNLLSNDDHYRGVARLWHQWSRLLVPRTPSAKEASERQQRVHRAFGAWCVLLVVRACEQLRLSPDDAGLERTLSRGDVVELEHGLRLSWEEDGAIVLRGGSETPLRFVPLGHALDAASSLDALRARTSAISSSMEGSANWTVVLHPGVLGGREWGELSGIGHPPMPGTRGAVDFVRVSPFSLDSVEMVARAIRWAVWAPRFLAYPPRLELQVGLIEAPVDLLRVREGREYVLLRPPSWGEQRALDLGERLGAEVVERDKLQEQMNAIREGLQRARGDRRETARLNKEKAALLKPLDDAGALVERLQSADRELRAALAQFAPLGQCPVCGQVGEFEIHDGDVFESRCRDAGCGAAWGLRRLEGHAARAPFLLPGDVDPESWPPKLTPQWADSVLGCDVLELACGQSGDV